MAWTPEFTQNYIYRIDRRSGQSTRLAAIDGPVYYSRAAGSQFFFGVTAELCPSQKGGAAELWCVDVGSRECRRVLTMAKDRSVRYFMPGSIDFPAGPGGEGGLLFRATALAGDGRTFSVRVPPAR